MLHGTKKESILQWYNTLKERDVTSLAQFTDGSLFYDIVTSLDSPEVGENGNIDSEEKYDSVKKCIDDIFRIDSISLINYSKCLIGNELELAKVAVFLLTALSIDKNLIKSLTHLDIQVQEDIKELLSFVFTDRCEDDGPIKKSEFHQLLSRFAGVSHRRQYSQSSESTDHNEASNGGKKTSKKRKDRASSIVYQDNQDCPLKPLLESPKFVLKLTIRRKEYEYRMLRNAVYMEKKVLDMVSNKIIVNEILEKKNTRANISQSRFTVTSVR
ncbi:uncharacterized protein TNCT_115561 [Trichonephila clavata]|uniref:Nuclear mitotic apparatus protein 1 N-terminal hook domain-containing protein n=1 Tax=Trichonephila clavata TaxID=2740835 RepID=A0A8X6M1N9_TRICU|nr:uncharacterized protein TNCT_115561 [Trichonephila clavata]